MPASGQAVSLWDAIQILPRRGPPTGLREGPDRSSILNRLALLVPGATSAAAAASVNSEGHGGQAAEVESDAAEPDGDNPPTIEDGAAASDTAASDSTAADSTAADIATTGLPPAESGPDEPGEPDIAMPVSDTPDADPPLSFVDEFVTSDMAATVPETLPPALAPLQADPFAAVPEPETPDALAEGPPAAFDGVLTPPAPVEADWPGEMAADEDDSETAPDGHDPAPAEVAAQDPQETAGDDISISAEAVAEDDISISAEAVAGANTGADGPDTRSDTGPDTGPDIGINAGSGSSEDAEAGALPPPVAAEPASDTTARQFLSYLVHPAGSRASACDVATVCRALGGADLDVEPLPLADAFGDSALALTVNGKTIIAMTIDAPLPADVPLRGDPQAIAAARTGAAHTVLALIEPVDSQPDALDGAAAMTTVLSAMASVVPAEAAVFTASGVCATVETLNACARELSHGQAPVRLWFEVGLHLPVPGADQRLRLAATTTGLAPFIGREIEFAAATIGRRDLRRRMLALSAHLAVNGFAMSGGVGGESAAAPAITAQFVERGELVAGPALVLSLAEEAAADA